MRKGQITGLLMVFVLIASVSCSNPEPEDPAVVQARKEAQEIQKRESIQSNLTRAIGPDFDEPTNIKYFRDDRTGLCFAFLWGGYYNGGPGLAEVPCEKVKHLLAPSQQKKMEQEEAAR